MNRVLLIQTILNALFPDPPMSLLYSSNYTLLIAVLLSAQCTDKLVNEVTPKLFAKASTAKEMAQLSEEAIAEMIRPCGLSKAKSRAIKKLSEILIETYQGKIPQTIEALERLPGVGHKTACVVAINALNIPAFPVDTHIHRCAKRWGLSSGKTVKQTEKDLMQQFPESSWKTLHLQIIYYARRYCPAKGHQIESCPICHSLQGLDETTSFL